MNVAENKACCAHNLDTLAQLRKHQENQGLQSDKKDQDHQSNLLKRARSKYLTNGLVQGLINANANALLKDPKSKSLSKAYWNTYHCCKELKTDRKGNLKAEYCKNRWCLVCNRIKTATLIKKHIRPLRKLPDVHFVTLTIPNVPGSELKDSISLMLKKFTLIKDRLRKQGTKLVGVRKLECTYNQDRNDYHPHFHCIISGKQTARLLHDNWLREFTKADEQGQDIRSLRSTQAIDEAIKEVFKYFTKLISNRSKERVIHAHALDIIFKAMIGKRVFQNFGYKTDQVQDDMDQGLKVVKYADPYYLWDDSRSDWIGFLYGYPLTGYKPNDKLKHLIENCIIDKKQINDSG